MRIAEDNAEFLKAADQRQLGILEAFSWWSRWIRVWAIIGIGVSMEHNLLVLAHTHEARERQLAAKEIAFVVIAILGQDLIGGT